MNRKELFTIIEKSDGTSRLSRAYDIFMLCMIVLSVVPLAFWEQHTLFIYIEWLTTAVFIIDYILRWTTADYKVGNGKASFWIYPFTGWAIIDLISILPSLNFLGKGFKIVRTIRLLKLLRLLKALRYSNQILIFLDVLKRERRVLYSVLIISVIYILVTALIMFNCEPHDAENPTFETYYDALYWATVTLTTVGYGDVCPVSNIGRFIGMLSAIFGVAIIALPSGIITASYLDELKVMKGEKIAERLRKSFRRTFSRASKYHPRYYVVPRKVSAVTIQVKQGIGLTDIIETVESCPDMRLRNTASAIPVSEHPVDNIVIEQFPVNRAYGCCIDRGSKITIVSPCSYSEAGIGNTAYYLALIGGFNYISKEIELDRDQPKSFYNIEEEDENLTLFLTDLKTLTQREDSWMVTLISCSSTNESQLHFIHGQQKGDNGFGETQHCTIIDSTTYMQFYAAIETAMAEEFSLKICQQDAYAIMPQNIAYSVEGGSNLNAFTLRMAYSLTYWDSKRLDKLQVLAEQMKSYLEPSVPMPEPDASIITKGFGYEE